MQGDNSKMSCYVVWETDTYGYIHADDDNRQVGFIYKNSDGMLEVEWLP